ncbi:MAG: multiheme c-type cytochrome [Nitrospirota bacterium]
MEKKALAFTLVWVLFGALAAAASEPPVSSETQACLGCHESVTPGIVADWKISRHSGTTPAEAMEKAKSERRVSARNVPENLRDSAVGCYECHSRNTDKHTDSFNHFDYTINVVVSPRDCATCHPVEVDQYAGSKKANAWGNLQNNPVYHTLVDSVIGEKSVENLTITSTPASYSTRNEACFHCHGSEVKVTGTRKVKTAMGVIEVPELTNWPNDGVGRLNPDGTKGCCTSCHARHSFSIQMARMPYTCAQCHLEPDVPAWNVYKESKHGNIFETFESDFNYTNVPWTVGEDFNAPTCSVCHVSLLVTPAGNVLAERSHDFGARLWVRLFGLIYTHPQPKSGDTTVIRNADDLPLPTTFTGKPASEYLIGKKEQAARKEKMMAVCKGCHSTRWVTDHFAEMDNTLKETDAMTLAATKLLLRAWDEGLADRENPFDEAIERMWVKQWLFYGNTARYSSAMTGAPDYIAFKYGWWGLTTNLADMKEVIQRGIELKRAEKEDRKE